MAKGQILKVKHRLALVVTSRRLLYVVPG